MDTIYVPSQATGNEIVAKGLTASKITLYPRGIDIQRFHPAKRNGFLKHRLKIENAVTMLYVGRISREKNLPLMVDVFKALMSNHAELHLVLVGDGPWRTEMQQALTGLPCTFTGYLTGNDLPVVYASSDLFVFPSNTDTFGNVVLEAQASGIPVIVSNQGGPHENMQPGQTGLLVTENSVKAWVEAIEILLENPEKRRRMGSNARKLMENRSFEEAQIQTFEMYKHFSWKDAVNDQ
jgi:glycosyltransferase involved in cell wall biosynthesis